MVRASSGLAAAHEQGLVHRDFKPDNLMIGRDGRVRVMDFGLVRPDRAAEVESDDTMRPTTDALALELTRAGGMMGTPAYMSPEQHMGEVVDARSDQFSFCVALWEALFGARPFGGASVPELVASVTTGTLVLPDDTRRVPSQLRRILERGLAVERAARWPSMRDLVAQLRRDPTQRRRRIAYGVVGVVLVGGGIGVWQLDRIADLAACRRDGESITTVWNDDVRGQVDARLSASGTAYAEHSARTVAAALDQHATGWTQLRTATCVAGVEGSDAATETIACLDDSARDLSDVVATLLDGDASTLRRAVLLANGLAPPDDCVDETTLHRRRLLAGTEAQREQVAPLRERIRRAQLASSLSKHDEAKAELEQVIAEARAIDALAVLASATYFLGAVEERRGDYPAAERTLVDAIFAATAAGDEYSAAYAAMDLAAVIGFRLGRTDDAELWERWATVLVERLGVGEDLIGAGLEDRLANVAHARGDFAAAATRLQHALAIKRARLGSDHPELAATLVSLGNAQMQSEGVDAAAASWNDALALLERSVGPSHPDLGPVLSSLAHVAFLRGDPKAAREHLERAIVISTAETGESHPEVAKLLGNLGIVLQESGDLVGARDAVMRSTAILEATLGEEHRSVAHSLNNLGALERALGNPDASLALQQRALEIQEKAVGAEHIDVALTCVELGAVYDAKGDLAEAQRWYARALAVSEKSGPSGHPIHTPVIRFELGDVLRRAGRVSEAIEQLEGALAGLESSGQSAEAIARARFTLGFALWERERERARREIDAARASLVAMGKHERVAEIDAWLVAHAK
jgi:tetratricopeptide (TPR) repeat protein